VGLWAGYLGRWVDGVSMRLVDVLLAFPGLLLAIGLIAITGPGVGPVIVASSVFGVPVFARLVRGSTLAVKERAFVEAARGLGAADAPHHVPPPAARRGVADHRLRHPARRRDDAGGRRPLVPRPRRPAPDPEWGSMLSQAQLYLRLDPLMAFAPGIAITLAVLGFNLLGDGLRDVLDPTLRD
jgi:glutathione transport system permease protein